jgi:3'-5' exoribonuclease
MKEQFVSGLAEGMTVDAVFAVRSRDLRAARTGDAYLTLELSDRSGAIPAVMFRPGPEEWSIPLGTVVQVRGRVTTFRGVRRISVESLRPCSGYDRRDLIAAGSRITAELVTAFGVLSDGVSHKGLRAVLDEAFAEEDFVRAFRECPAAVKRHHAYVGGLLEHTVAVASLCRVLAASYDGADADLLVTAALLHDVGKVQELRFDTSVELADAGRLVGHVVLGERIVSRAIERVGNRLDPALALRLVHLVISHHGRPEWGAPVSPATLEAVLLHHADDLDARVTGFVQAVAGAAVLDEQWTDADNWFRRQLYVPMTAQVSSACGVCVAP